MRFRTIAIAAVILVLAAAGALGVLYLSDISRGEAAQNTIERSDSLAVEPGIIQHLASDDDHDPTRYADSINVTFDGQQWNESEEYAYYQNNGSIEFLVDEDDPANISYAYDIPRNQDADGMLQNLTVSTGLVLRLAGGLSFVVLFLFIGAFVARRMRVNTGGRGR